MALLASIAPSRVLVLHNALSDADLADEAELAEVADDLAIEVAAALAAAAATAAANAAAVQGGEAAGASVCVCTSAQRLRKGDSGPWRRVAAG